MIKLNLCLCSSFGFVMLLTSNISSEQIKVVAKDQDGRFIHGASDLESGSLSIISARHAVPFNQIAANNGSSPLEDIPSRGSQQGPAAGAPCFAARASAGTNIAYFRGSASLKSIARPGKSTPFFVLLPIKGSPRFGRIDDNMLSACEGSQLEEVLPIWAGV